MSLTSALSALMIWLLSPMMSRLASRLSSSASRSFLCRASEVGLKNPMAPFMNEPAPAAAAAATPPPLLPPLPADPVGDDFDPPLPGMEDSFGASPTMSKTPPDWSLLGRRWLRGRVNTRRERRSEAFQSGNDRSKTVT